MIYKLFNNFYILLTLIIFNVLPAVAQKETRADSIIRSSSSNIYENPDKAISSGLAIYDDDKNTLETRVKAMIMVSDAYSSKRDYQKALKCFLMANELSKQSNNVGMKISILNKTAIKYQQLKVYDKAIRYLDEAEKLIVAIPVHDSTQMPLATNLIVRGFIFKEQLNCDIAISYFRQGIAVCKQVKSMDTQPILSIATYNMGNCYTLLNNYGKAKESFNEALMYANKAKAKSLKAFAQKGLAEVYTLEGDYRGSISILESALEISKNVGDLILNREIYKGLSNNYLAINEWDKYQLYQKKYVQIQLDIKESERTSISDSIEEINALQNKKIHDEKMRYGWIIFIVATLAIMIIIFLVKFQIRSIKSLNQLKSNIEEMMRVKQKNIQ